MKQPDTFYSYVSFCILWFRWYSSMEQSRCLKAVTMVRRPQMCARIAKTPRCHVKQSLQISSWLGRRTFRICVHSQINVCAPCMQNMPLSRSEKVETPICWFLVHGSAYEQKVMAQRLCKVVGGCLKGPSHPRSLRRTMMSTLFLVG